MVRIREGNGLGTVVCFHAIGGMISSYGSLFREVPAGFALYGVESPRNPETIQQHAGIEALASYYVGLIEALQPVYPLVLGGWCVGADLALNLQDKLDRRGIPVAVAFGLDANLDFSVRKVMQQCREKGSEDVWRFFTKIMAGPEFIDELFASSDFLKADKVGRVERVYKARDGHPDRSHIKRDLVNPTWQFDFIDELLDASRHYRFQGNRSNSKILLFSDASDKHFVLREAINVDAPALELAFYDTSHRGLLEYPHIKHIVARVIDTIELTAAE
ncbi:thioesterase domain-containing protein [Sphingomonas panacis]|nr:thioesterase domain-containing protein [Sphingomonas panacis]